MTCSEILIEQKSEPCSSATLQFSYFLLTPNSEPRPEEQEEQSASYWFCWGSGEICRTMAATGLVTPGSGSAGSRPPPHFSGPTSEPSLASALCTRYPVHMQLL